MIASITSCSLGFCASRALIFHQPRGPLRIEEQAERNLRGGIRPRPCGSKVTPVCPLNDSCVRGYPGGRGGKICNSESGSVSVAGEIVFNKGGKGFALVRGSDDLASPFARRRATRSDS